MGVTKGVFRYRYRCDPGKLYKTFTKDQSPPSIMKDGADLTNQQVTCPPPKTKRMSEIVVSF